MTVIQHQMSLHEKTVQAMEEQRRYRRGRGKDRSPRPSQVNVTQVDPRIMAAALRAAGGDASRLDLSDAANGVVWVR